MPPETDAQLVRSWLFVPAVRPERFAKAVGAGADAVIVDLEDAVPAGQKDDARRHAVTWLTSEHTANAVRCLRVNALRSAAGLRDVLALIDAGALRDESERVRRLGFTGKLAIHPDQVATIHAAYTPSDGDVERARRVTAAVEAAGGGVAVVDGRMVDAPVVRAAARTLALAARR
jgi:citrate lyase beta subunit